MTTGPSASDSSCPKCGHHRRGGESACPRCGLTFALWTAEKAAEVVGLDAKAEALWTELDGSWDDDTKHDAFLKYCSVAGLLAPAGRCYRDRLARHPGDPTARRMQERIVTMATLSFTRPAARPLPVTRSTWFWAVMFLCGVAGVAAALLLGGR
jgi:uncharacterized Zn finger protein (UPF0148 family)